MKLILKALVAILVLTTANNANAQTRIMIDNAEKPAVAIQIQGNKNDIRDALDVYFEKLGSNLKKSNGLYLAKNVSIPQLSTEKLDMYLKIDQLGKDKNNLSNIAMAVKTTSDMFVGDSSHKDIFALLPIYLQSFDQIVKDFVKQRSIDALNKQAAKATKKQGQLEKRAEKKGEEAKKLDLEAKKVG